MRVDSHDELDQILDSALASYCAQQPRPGIEQRVIARLLQPAMRRHWLRWVVPVPALAGLLLITYWIKPSASPASTPQYVVRKEPVKRDLQPSPATTVAQAAPGRKVRVMRPSVVKAAVFPTPSPLTEEERVLVQLAASAPELLHSVQIDRQHWNQPLTVEPINIPPLDSPDWRIDR
jgi:hypothetical protein